MQAEGGATPPVTDNLSSVYTKDCDLTYNQGFGAGRRMTIYHLQNAPGGITTVNITPSAAARAIVAEYSGIPASGAVLDVCGTVNNQTTGVTSWTSPPTTTTSNDLVLGIAETGTVSSAGYAAGTGWTGRQHQGNSSAAVTLVQAAVPTGSSPWSATVVGAAFPKNTTAGNTIAVWGGWAMSSGATNSLTSVTGQGGTCTLDAASTVNSATTNYTDIGGQWAYCTGIPGGVKTAITCHFTSTVQYTQGCLAYELTPIATVLQSTGTGSGTAVSAGSVTAASGSYGISAMVIDDGIGLGHYFGAVGTGWTAKWQQWTGE